MTVINGTSAGEFLPGADGDDTLTAGQGDDNVQGGAGNDTYVFTRGDGADYYYDDSGANTIVFTDVKSTELVGIDGLAYGSLRLKYSATDSIVLQLASGYYGTAYQPVSYQFSDSITLTHEELLNKFTISFHNFFIFYIF